MTVVLTGLGATAAPQEPLDTASKSRLVEQWTEIANASGATCVAVDEEPLTGNDPDERSGGQRRARAQTTTAQARPAHSPSRPRYHFVRTPSDSR